MRKFLVLIVPALLLSFGALLSYTAPVYADTETPAPTGTSHLGWPTDYPTIDPTMLCDIGAEPTVTPFATLDVPTVEPIYTDLPTGTVGPTVTGTVTVTPEYKIVPLDEDDPAAGSTQPDGSLTAYYSLNGSALHDRDFSAGSWYSIVRSDGEPVVYGTEFDVYYYVSMSYIYGLYDVDPPCYDELTNRDLNAGGYMQLRSHVMAFRLDEHSPNTVLHCGGGSTLYAALSDPQSGVMHVIWESLANFAFSAYVVEGRVDGFLNVTGSTVYSLSPIITEPDPTPTPSGTPSPCVGFGPCTGDDCVIFEPPILIPGECYTVIPGGSIPLPVLEGLPETIDIPGFQVCTSYLSIDISVFGFELDVFIAILCGMTAVSIIYRELKS